MVGVYVYDMLGFLLVCIVCECVGFGMVIVYFVDGQVDIEIVDVFNYGVDLCF